MQNGTFSLQLGKDNGASPSSMNASRARSIDCARSRIDPAHRVASSRHDATAGVIRRFEIDRRLPLRKHRGQPRVDSTLRAELTMR